MKLLKYLYTNNPFYLISALLVLFGLKSIFPPGESSSYDWVLMGSLVSYIALLAATALVIIRTGRVWEDARSMLLVISFLMVALSVNFDEKVIAHPWSGMALLAGGLLFSVAVSETLLRGVPIRLAPRFRAPYYLLLGGFFLYPVILAFLLRGRSTGGADGGILAFPVFFGVCLLSLIPAIRRGAGYAAANGTPWKWPWFPWLLFGVLALCAAGRSYYFSFSFGQGRGEECGFAPYFLAPILLAACVLLLEAGIVAGSRPAKWVALMVPLALPLLGILFPVSEAAFGILPLPSLTLAQVNLIKWLAATVASPAFLTLIGVGLFYGYAAVRKAPHAEGAMVVTLLAFSIVAPGTIDLASLSAPRPWALIASSSLLLLFALRRPASWRFLAAAAVGIIGLTLLFGSRGFLWGHGAIPVHLFLVTGLLLGHFFNDPLARLVRDLSAIAFALIAIALLYLFSDVGAEVPGWAVLAYVAAVPVLELTCFYLGRAPVFYQCGALGLLLYIPRAAWEVGLLAWRFQWTRGTWMVLAGMAFFLLAAAISFLKAGILDGPKERLKRAIGERFIAIRPGRLPGERQLQGPAPPMAAGEGGAAPPPDPLPG